MTRRSAYPALWAGLVCVSTAGPFIRAAHIDAYAIVLLRLVFGTAIFLVWAIARGELRLRRDDATRTIAGALLLTLHFGLWVKAFDLTNYASNLVLLVAQPVTAAVLARELGEPQGRFLWPSLALAIAGLLTVAGGDLHLGWRALAGDALCVTAGFSIAVFYFITREARARTPLPTFMAVTFAVGAIGIAPVVLLTHARVVGFHASAWGWIAAFVLITTVCGHGLFNLAARRVPLFLLNIVIVLEPIIGIGIGALLFPTHVSATTIVGGAILSCAVVLAFL